MNHFFIILKHELKLLFISPATYVAGVVFLCIMGGIYWLALFQATKSIQLWLPVEAFFQLFWLPLFILVPLITMRSFAEERRLGTLGTLMTTPTKMSSIVLGKFFAAYLLYLILWAIAIAFLFVAWWILKDIYPDPRLLSINLIIGGSLFITLSGALYISLGILASSLTRSMLVAGLLSAAGLFILVAGGGLLQQLPFMQYDSFSWLQNIADYLHTTRHLENFSRGLIDSRPIFMFISGTFFFLGIATINLESKV